MNIIMILKYNVVHFTNYKVQWLFKELLLKNEQDQNPFHIAAKSGNTDNDGLSRLAFKMSNDQVTT